MKLYQQGNGNNDLYNAAEVGDLKRVMELVEQGVDKEEKGGSDDFTPLYIASENDHLEVVRYLVEQGTSIENVSGPLKWTALMTASYYIRLEVARFLLEQGANRDKADIDGSTSLHLVTEKIPEEEPEEVDRLELAKLLMVYGADLNAMTKTGQMPIDLVDDDDEDLKQAIRDEPRRRLDEAPGKRATEQDRHPNATSSASAQHEDDEEEDAEDQEQSNKKPRLDEGAVVEEGKVAEEDEDSEPSSDEGDNWDVIAVRQSIVACAGFCW